jgi:aspartate/methionine/tyrosine aminotransferase
MFHPFHIEQFLSEHEEGATFNFSESGVHPMSVGELFEMAGRRMEDIAPVILNYPEVHGTAALRDRIAELYSGAGPGNVLVTVGASEANKLVVETLLQPGDEVVALTPTYAQLTGNARNSGLVVRTAPLVEDRGWALDVDALEEAVTPDTRVITVVNPNNPTGRILDLTEMDAVIRAAQRVGAWIVADEVYAGAEREGREVTPSIWGRYDRVMVINSMSKAYGLPGLRLGWILAPASLIPALRRRHEYATIAATMLSNVLAEMALDPAVRKHITARARRLIDRGFDQLLEGLAEHPGVFSVVPPQASAMSFVRFDLPIGSRELALRLRREQEMLIVPGSCFGYERHFRFSSALPEPYLKEGLVRLNRLVATILEEAR